MKKLIYPAGIALLIGAFNLTAIKAMKGDRDMTISIGILVILLALIVYKNKSIKLQGNKNIFISLALVGIALTIINTTAAFIYAIAGVLTLTATQFNILSNSKPIWRLFGGNPLQELNQQQSKMSYIGLTIIVSVMLPIIFKVLWLKYAI